MAFRIDFRCVLDGVNRVLGILEIDMRLLLPIVSLLWLASPALACRPDPGNLYDDIPSPDLIVAVAEVTDVVITKSSDVDTCIAVGYMVTERLAGNVDDSFRVEVCYISGRVTEADLARTADETGFAVGATVLVGVIPSSKGSTELRYAVPNCWGPLHLRLDDMGEAERKLLIADYRQPVAGDEAEVLP